jgi:alkylated DNA repair dioxygenase AlkB
MTKAPQTKMRLMLGHGDLAVMLPGCQTHCQHQVPKQAKANARINLTFRVLQPQSHAKKRKHE